MADILLRVLLVGAYLFLCYFTILVTFIAYDELANSKWTLVAALLLAWLILFGGELGRALTWRWFGTCV